MRTTRASMLLLLITGALGAGGIAVAQPAPGSQRDCQTIRTCNFPAAAFIGAACPPTVAGSAAWWRPAVGSAVGRAGFARRCAATGAKGPERFASGHGHLGLGPRLVARARLVEDHQQRRQALGVDQAKDLDVVARALAPAGDLQRPLRLGEQAMVAKGLASRMRSSPSWPGPARLFSSHFLRIS